MSGIKFVNNDSETVINNLVTQFERATGETLQPSDERRIFLNNLAQVVVGLKSEINDSGNQVLLRYSRGEALDAIGELFGVTRLAASYAKCELQFTLSAVQSMDVAIPRGTRATPDGKIYFATDEVLTIKAGEMTGKVWATATVEGAANNGFVSGQIKYIVDNVNFLAEVKNTSDSSGGSDEESDDSLRERIRLVPESFSTAGCSDGYAYWAKSASPNVGDVVVYSPVNDMSLSEEERASGAGKVFIYILNADGSLPTANDATIQAVYNSVNDKSVRPLTDKVEVAPPTPTDFLVVFEYYISAENEVNATEIQRKVTEAVDEYVKWQTAKIGRDINPDKLRNLVLNAGASRINLTQPTFQVVSPTKVARLGSDPVFEYKGISE